MEKGNVNKLWLVLLCFFVCLFLNRRTRRCGRKIVRAGFFKQNKVALLTMCLLPQNTVDKNISVDSSQELDKFTENLTVNSSK